MAEQRNNSTNYFFQQLIFLDKHFTDTGHFFNVMSATLRQQGYVSSGFLAAIRARETAYPTALPVEPNAIALPHTDIEYILKPFILMARLKHPIHWQEMGNDGHTLNVKFVFLLGFTDKDSHIDLLQTLIEHINNKMFIEKLTSINTAENMVLFLRDNFCLQKS